MVTEFGTNDAQTVKLWSKLLMREAIHKTWMSRLMGAGPQAIVQRLVDLEKNAGDTIKYDLLVQMTQYGVTGDNPIEGFEEALVYYQDSLAIDQRRIAHAFRRMAQQRTVHQLRRDARENLSDRYAELYDYILFAQLCGTMGDDTTALPQSVAEHGGNSLVGLKSGEPGFVADADHLLDKNSETFRVEHIDILREKAKTIKPLIRPARFEGNEYYVLILHPYCVTDLRNTDPGSGALFWMNLQQYAGERGKNNPIFTGALGVYNGVVLHESTRIPRTGNVAHNLFLGAQSGVIGWGNAYSKLDQEGPMGTDNMMSWFERKADYGNERGVAAGSIYGCKPSRFNAKRFGMIRLDTTAAAH